MTTVIADGAGFVALGKQGENGSTQVQFPVVSEWVELFGEGVFQLLILRPTESTPYAVPVSVDGGNVCWVVSGTDVSIPGIGGCELRYTVGSTLAKSASYVTLTEKAIGGIDGPYPTPWEEWVDQVMQAAAEAEAAQTAAETAQGKAEDAQTAAESAQTGAETAQAAAEAAKTAADADASDAIAAKEAAQAAASSASEDAASATASQASAHSSAVSAGASATAAESSAASAASSASAAASSKTAAQTAQTAAETAQAAAELARADAIAAKNAADSDASSASASASSAEASKIAAAASETAAGTSAASASGSATAAASSATAAAGSATSAASSKTAAQAAQTAAETAQAAAEAAAASLVLDTTLTETGKAADSKAVGDAIAQTRDAVDAQLVPVSFAPALTRGSFFKTADGSTSSDARYARTTALWEGYGHRIAVRLDSDVYEYRLLFYDASGTTGGVGYLGCGEYTAGVAYIPREAAKFGINFRRVDRANLAAADVTDILAALSAFAPTDATLSAGGMAADAKTVGDKIGRIDGEILYETPFDPGSSDVTGYITNSNLWTQTQVNRKCGIAPIPEGTLKIAVQANADEFTNIAILASSAHTANTTPDYAAGWSDQVRLDAGQTAEFEVPADGKFLYYAKKFDTAIRTPQSITYYAGRLSAAEAQVKDNTTLLSPVNLAKNAPLFTKAINAATGEEITSSLYHIDYIDVSEYDNILYSRLWSTSSSSGITSGMAFYDEEKSYISGLKNQANAPELSSSMYFMHVPENAKYARFTWSASLGEFILYDAEQYYNSVTTQLSTMALQLGLHETPLDTNKLNIIKRARQMTDIKWTPAADLPRYMKVSTGGTEIPDTASVQNYLGTFKAGVEYTGIPYGRVSETLDAYHYSYGTVGRYIDFGTFVSSAANPKSALCRRNVGSVSGHRSTIYATVCSGLTCYALGVSEVATAGIGSISGLATVGKLNDSGALLPDYAIRVGDVLNLAGYHTGIITDIIRGDDGTVRFVEISEATTKGLADRNYDDGQAGGLCIRRGWTREQLYDSGIWGEYSVLRYYGTVPYTPNAYAPIAGELDAYRIEQFPIMPYEGEGFAFKAGYVPDNAVKLVITLGGYDYVKVFKDGVEITGSPFAVTTDAQTGEINDITVSEIGEGSYTAYLCNIADGNVTNLSYACHWTVGSASRSIDPEDTGEGEQSRSIDPEDTGDGEQSERSEDNSR